MKRFAKMLKKSIKYASLFLLALVVALIVLPFIFQDELKLKVKEYLNERISADVNFTDIQLSAIAHFPRLTLGVKDLLVSKDNGFENDTIIFSEEVILEMPLYSLWEKTEPVQVYEFDINQVKLNIFIDEEGKRNYDIVPSKQDTQTIGDIKFDVRRYGIAGGKINFKDDQSLTELLLDDISHTGKGDFSQSKFDLTTSTTIDQLSYSQQGVSIIENWETKAEGKFNVDLHDNRYQLDQFSFWLNKVELAATGFFKLNAENTELDLVFNTKKNAFKDYLSLLPNVNTVEFQKIDANGMADIDGSISGILNPGIGKYPKFNIHSNIQNAYVKFPEFKIPISDINGDLSIKNEGNTLDGSELLLKNFTAKLNEEQLNFSLRARNLTSDPFLDCDFDGKLILEDFANAYPLPGIKEMKGQITADVKLIGQQSQLKQGNYENTVFEGQMNGQDINVLLADGMDYQVPAFATEWNKEELNISALSLKQANTDFYAEGKLIKPLRIFQEDKAFNGQVFIQAKRIDLNPYIEVEQVPDSSLAAPAWMQGLKKANLLWQAEIGELNYATYDILNATGKGRLNQDVLTIENFDGLVSGSDFTLSGSLSNVISYNTEQDTITGTLTFQSNKTNANTFLEDQKKQEVKTRSPYPVIPERLNITIDSRASQMQYGLLSLAEISGKLNLLDQRLDMRDFSAELFGGKINLEGSYQQLGESSPEFSLKYGMENIPFSGAYQSMPSVKSLAPIFSFIEGFFNASLIMNGKLGENLFPDLTSLTAAGFMETTNGKIKSLPYLDKLNTFFAVNMSDAWSLVNTKNWFDIENGTLTLKEYKHVWKDMEFSIAGQHKLNQEINYLVKAKVPKSKINATAIGTKVNQALDGFIDQAVSKGVVKRTEDPYLLLDFNLRGDIKNPIVSVKPKGISGIEISNPLENIIESKTNDAKEKAGEILKKEEEKLTKKTEEVKDSIAREIEKKADEAINAGKGKVGEIIDSSIKNKIPEVVPDSLKTKVDKTLDDLFGDKAKDDIKDKLKDFNPFKKKKKND